MHAVYNLVLEGIRYGLVESLCAQAGIPFELRRVARSEVLEADDIFVGVNALDYSGYPDCRPEFVEAFERLANLATKAAVEGARVTIHAPLLHLAKAEIISRGLALGVDYGLTTSCYDPAASGEACGACDACRLRIKGFAEAGLEDPAQYVVGG